MLRKPELDSISNFPTWLQVLVPTLDSDSSSDTFEWAGRVRELKNSVRQVKERLELGEEERRREVKGLRRQLEESERRREDSEREMKEMLKVLVEGKK